MVINQRTNVFHFSTPFRKQEEQECLMSLVNDNKNDLSIV